MDRRILVIGADSLLGDTILARNKLPDIQVFKSCDEFMSSLRLQCESLSDELAEIAVLDRHGNGRGLTGTGGARSTR